MDRRELRTQILAECGAGCAEIEELLRYNENVFNLAAGALAPSFPLADEPFVETWERYAEDASRNGAVAALRMRLPQFRFPIAEGISHTDAYRASTRRGEEPPPDHDLTFRSPEQCRIVIHATAAGRIPLLILGDRADFIACVQALTCRNEPVPVPDSMGACIVAGYNNWDRVRSHRLGWESSAPAADERAWQVEFARLIPRKELYQDRFILLSEGPYSGVQATEVGLCDEEWRELSLVIRREHECAHYFTRRIFGSMRNNLLDELIADYMGLVAACGRFRADWLLRFLGLHDHPRYHGGGRLQNYRGDPPLSDGSFVILQHLVVKAAYELERFDRSHQGVLARPNMQGMMLLVLSEFTLEELASAASQPALESALLRRSQHLPS